jgi:hypothetical protein
MAANTGSREPTFTVDRNPLETSTVDMDADKFETTPRDGDVRLDFPSRQGKALPDDLRTCFEEAELAATVREVVTTLDPAGDPGQPPFHNPERVSIPVLLAILTFSYLTGRFCSDDIEDACHDGRLPGCLGPPECPSSATLSRFRRTHRPQLSAALGGSLLALALRRSQDEAGRLRGLIAAEVKRRIDAAIRTDSMARDF